MALSKTDPARTNGRSAVSMKTPRFNWTLGDSRPNSKGHVPGYFRKFSAGVKGRIYEAFCLDSTHPYLDPTPLPYPLFLFLYQNVPKLQLRRLLRIYRSR